jgi:eukaryotic-like serine/threonine-protein kinase
MSLRKFLTSRVFFAQIATVLAVVAGIAYLFFHWITYVTHHGEEIIVPNLNKMTEAEVEDKLDELNLSYLIIDTMDYNPKFPKLAVVQQDPIAGAKVKEGRKVYIKINAASYKLVAIPDLIDKTYRQAVPTLKSIGLIEGTITYVPHIGKDMVLDMSVNGKRVRFGQKVFKATKIDLVLGDGEVEFDETLIDSLKNELPYVEPIRESEMGENKDTINGK